MKTKRLETDVLIIGGGTAGCFAAYTLGKEAGVSVLIAEKANIKRSGCLAAGVNALNAYITEGHVPQDYVDYAKKDAHGIDVSGSKGETAQQVGETADEPAVVEADGQVTARKNVALGMFAADCLPVLMADAEAGVIGAAHCGRRGLQNGVIGATVE